MSEDIIERLRSAFPNTCAQWEAADIIESLRQQLADSQKQVTLLRDALKSIHAIEDKLFGSDWEEIDEARDIANVALAATADLSGVILCHAEPVAWQTFDGEGGYDYRSYEDNEDYRDDYIKRNSSQKFYENWVIPLYRAWEPK